MSAVEHPLQIEGTWEEVVAQGSKLAGRRVRVTVIEPAAESPTQAELQQSLQEWLDESSQLTPQPRERPPGQEKEIEDLIAEKFRKQGFIV